MFFRFPLYRRSFLACALAVATVLPTWLMPSSVAFGSGEAASLDRTKQQIAQIKQKLASAKGEASAIASQVNALDGQIASLNRQISGGERDISGLESELRTDIAKIGELEDQYSDASKSSNERAKRLYTQGPAEQLSRLLNAKSVLEFTRLQVLLKVASDADGKAMIRASRIRGDLLDRKAEIERIKGDIHAQKQWLEQRRALIASARGDREAAYRGVQSQIDSEEQNLKALLEQSKALEQAIRGSLSKSSGAVSRTGFIWPVNGPITSPYGPRWGSFHPGIDIGASTGTPIRASKAGTITSLSCGSGYGLCTIIDHGGGVSTLYAHQSRIAMTGGFIQQGQVLGYVGCTGYCTGPHLHFEVRVNGSPQNPRNFLP